MNDDQPIGVQLAALKEEHRRLDHQIADLIEAGAADQLELARLKKRKLWLKDMIQQVSDLNTPDIIA
ncbi:MAG: YdcH family protein [Sphingomicrobium sp.]